MNDAILVLNAGSSSLKFSLFAVESARLDLLMHGQIESLYTSPQFTATTADGTVFGTGEWGEAGARFGHDNAIERLISFLRSHLAGHELLAIGHRVVHGGTRFSEPTRVTATVLKELSALIPLAP